MVHFINTMKAVSGNMTLFLCLFTACHKFILVWTQIQINFIIFCLRNNNTFMSWDSLMKSNDSNLIWWLEFPKWASLLATALPPILVPEIFLDYKAIIAIAMCAYSNQMYPNIIDICQFISLTYLLSFLTYLFIMFICVCTYSICMYYVFLNKGSMFCRVHGEVRVQLFRVCSLHPSWVLGTELKSSGLYAKHSYILNYFVSPKISFNHH